MPLGGACVTLESWTKAQSHSAAIKMAAAAAGPAFFILVASGTEGLRSTWVLELSLLSSTAAHPM